MGDDDLPAVVPTAQFFRALAAQLPTQLEVDLFVQTELEAIMTLVARHYDELRVIDGVAELSSAGRLRSTGRSSTAGTTTGRIASPTSS